MYGDKAKGETGDGTGHAEPKARTGLPEFTFVRYEQSSKCVSGKDSSVSYVSGVLRVPEVQ
jgi:hypothetical protein